MKKKGIYLIQESGCLNSKSGAFQHISMGVKHLSKTFDLEVYLNTKKIKLDDFRNVQNSEQTHNKKVEKKAWLYGTLKDISILFSNLLKIPKLYKLFKTQKIDFVYERVSYLDVSGLVATRLAGIKHFYEANGLQYLSRKKYYDSNFTTISRSLEKAAYTHCHFNFFIGTYGDFWQIEKKNWINIENGIEKKFLLVQQSKKELNKKLQLCFIGRPMKHHGLELLNELFGFEEVRQKTTLHFIGEGFKQIENELKSLGADVINHGFKRRKEILELAKVLDLGLVLKTPEYASNMKIFDYALLNCVILSFNSYNLNYWFKDELIFHDGSVSDLKNQLDNIIQNPEIILKKAQMLRTKVCEQHTWDKVFELEARMMQQCLNELK